MTNALASTLPLAAIMLSCLFAGTADARPVQSWRTGAYDNYTGPDGRYDNLSDLTRSIEGTPCGVACTDRAQARWGLTQSNR